MAKVQKKFVGVPSHILADPNLSWRAKGIFAYISSLPTNYAPNMTELPKYATDGMTSIESGIKELHHAGVLNLVRHGVKRGSTITWVLNCGHNTNNNARK